MAKTALTAEKHTPKIRGKIRWKNSVKTFRFSVRLSARFSVCFSVRFSVSNVFFLEIGKIRAESVLQERPPNSFALFCALVAHDCGYHLSRYTCRATRVATDFLDFIAFCRCSTGVALHPLNILVSHLPPPVPGGVAPKFGSEKVSRYTGVSQLQLRV